MLKTILLIFILSFCGYVLYMIAIKIIKNGIIKTLNQKSTYK